MFSVYVVDNVLVHQKLVRCCDTRCELRRI